MIVYSNNKACLLWLVKPRDTESLQSKRYLKKIYRLSILVYSNNKAYCIVTNETEREAKKAAMRALIERRSISLLE